MATASELRIAAETYRRWHEADPEYRLPTPEEVADALEVLSKAAGELARVKDITCSG